MAKDNISPLGSLEDISNACKELIKFNINEKANNMDQEMILNFLDILLFSCIKIKEASGTQRDK